MRAEIIAEIAQGYEGNPFLASILVKGAVAANADSIKMQLIYADELAVPDYPYYEFFKSLEMEESVWVGLIELAHSMGKKFYFDIYGSYSLDLARKLKCDGIKISTTDFYNVSLREAAFNKFDDVFVSIGGVSLQDIDELLSTSNLPRNLTLLYGFQAEPTDIVDNNLNRIARIKKKYPDIKIGFMDHTDGSSKFSSLVPILSLGMGICAIEKHISLDLKLKIEDYVSALSVDRFAEFVTLIRAIEPALGDDTFNLTDKEIKYKNTAGKIVVAKNSIKINEKLTTENVCMKRVDVNAIEGQISNMIEVLGRTSEIDLEVNQPIYRHKIK